MEAFIDDLLIYSENEIEHRNMCGESYNGIQASISKYKFHIIRTKYLGYILTTGEMQRFVAGRLQQFVESNPF
jgi:hypothetical protein